MADGWLKRLFGSTRHGEVADVPPPREGDLFVCLDFETTGLEPSKDRVIEVGAIRVNPEFANHVTFQTLVNPAVPVSKKITQITGLTRQQLEDEGEPPEKVFRQLYHFIGRLPLVAYNAPFDASFLVAEYERIGIDHDVTFVDVLERARNQLNLSSYKLEAVARHLQIDVKPTHRALDDAHVAMLVYDKLLAMDC